MKKHLDKIIIFLIVLLLVFAGYLQIVTIDSTEKLRKDELIKTEQYAKKIAKLIQQKTGNHIEQSLTESEHLRNDLNEVLEAFLTKQYIYIFMLYKDEENHFRFLLDGSVKEEDKGEFKEFFTPKSNSFYNVYDTGKIQIIERNKNKNDMEDIWMTLLYPIVVDGKTEALLSLELSSEYADYLNTFNSPLMSVVHWMQWFLVASMLLLVFLAYRYYHLNKSLMIDKKTTAYTKRYINDFFNENKIKDYNGFLVDIDEFKNINEQYGQDFGDKFIKLFVQRMNNKLINGSQVVSSGGTEFVIFLPKTTNKIKSLAEKFYKEIKDVPYELDGHTISLRISMSAMCIPPEAKLVSNIQRVLDEQLLLVKNRGKNSLIVLDDNNIDTIKYGNLDYVKESLNDKRICCLYQPIVKVDDKITTKYEALVRMIDKDDNSKLVSPYFFLKTIKGTSQYIKMSKMVLEDVFETLEKYPTIHISMNLDLDDLYNINLIDVINTYLEKHQDISKRITFEILEENNIYDYNKVNTVFTQLRKYGSKIAIDDFGSGYANYTYLTKLDVDIIKIDGSLISNLLLSPERSKIVLVSIKDLADKLNLEVIAEFVSNEKLYKLVKEIGITYAQGYYLGEPKPIDYYLK